ncbi:hypothetical protein GGR51DRAFT_554149 [Nemania sp. FL0031]|nr:hypothetical protein GGR51DRAFT_554149 [Nemania sp. FL0031]
MGSFLILVKLPLLVLKVDFDTIDECLIRKGLIDRDVRRPKKGRDEPANLERKANDIVLPNARVTQESGRKAAEKQKVQAPVFGVDHVERLVEEDPDGGLTYVWFLCHHPSTVPPVDRMESFTDRQAFIPGVHIDYWETV